MIKEGDICIWQNSDKLFEYLNGEECTVLSNLMMHSVRNYLGLEIGKKLGYSTDTRVHTPYGSGTIVAKPHQLRLKNPPPEDKEIEAPAQTLELVGAT
jgi:hypothetical protein